MTLPFFSPVGEPVPIRRSAFCATSGVGGAFSQRLRGDRHDAESTVRLSQAPLRRQVSALPALAHLSFHSDSCWGGGGRFLGSSSESRCNITIRTIAPSRRVYAKTNISVSRAGYEAATYGCQRLFPLQSTALPTDLLRGQISED